MKSKRSDLTRILFTILFACFMMMSLSLIAFAEESDDMLRDNGVEERNDAYEFTIDTEQEAVGASAGISSGGWSSLGSELSYMEFPEDTTTPDGENGLWCYCIDITTSTQDGHKYSVTTLDAAEYYKDEVSGKIRAILLNSYPYNDIDTIEQNFGLEDLTEEEAFIATQWIIWYYSNPDGLVEASGGNYYPANIYKPSEYEGETIPIWYDDADGNEVFGQSANVVKLAKGLDALDPAGAYETEPAEIIVEKRKYDDRVVFDFGNTKSLDALENLSISVKDENGNDVPFALDGTKITVKHEDLTMIEDVAELTVDIRAEQRLNEDVYFFSPEGGREASQSRVAAFGGVAPVAATIDFGLTRSGFEGAEPDAKLKVTKKVLLNGEAHRTEDIYYVALFEDKDCTLLAFNGDVREIRMGGEAEGSVIFDELVPGKIYYVAETDADGNPLKDGDLGIAVIAYDRQEVVVSPDFMAEVVITNCYVEEKKTVEDDPAGGIGEGDIEEGPDEKKPVSETPDTGEDLTMVLWAMMVLTSLAIMLLVMLLSRKKVYR